MGTSSEMRISCAFCGELPADRIFGVLTCPTCAVLAEKMIGQASVQPDADHCEICGAKSVARLAWHSTCSIHFGLLVLALERYVLTASVASDIEALDTFGGEPS